jgi:hypothetical protein
VAAHGYARPTKDLGVVRLDTDLGPLDVMQWVAGVDTEDLHRELDGDALAFTLDDIPRATAGSRSCGR